MQPWGKRLILAGCLVVAVWVMVILYWRAGTHMPSKSDVAKYLILLPLMLLTFIFLIWRMSQRLGMSGISSPASIVPVNVSVDENREPAQAVIPSALAMVASSIITRYGPTIEDMIAGLGSAQADFELDPQLTDRNGYPILSGRIAELNAADLFSQYRRWMTIHGMLVEDWISEDARAIALAYQVCTELSQTLLTRFPFIKSTSDAEAIPQAHIWPLLCLVFVSPERWSVSQKNSIMHWFAEVINQEGWPVERLVIYPLDELGTADPLALINQLNIEGNRSCAADYYLLIASQSFIGEDSVVAAQAGHQVYPGQRTRIPGEAAAGLVLTTGREADKASPDSAVYVHLSAWRQRDKTADDVRRISPEMLIETIRDALEFAGTSAEQIVGITADTDARANRIGELYEAMQEIAPEMEMAIDCFKAGNGCGDIGAVASLAALLAASQLVSEKRQPVVCVCNNDETALTAAVITHQPGRRA